MSQSPSTPAPDPNPFKAPESSTIIPAENGSVDLTELVMTRTGVQTTYWGVALVFGSVLLSIPLAATQVASGPGGPGGPDTANPMYLIPTLVSLMGYVLMFVGECICISTPEKAGRMSVILAVIFQVLSIVGIFGLMLFIPGLDGDPGSIGGSEEALNSLIAGISVISLGVMWTASQFLYLNFLRRVNRYVDHERNARLARSTSVVLLGIYLGAFALGVVVGLVQPNTDQFAIMMLILGIAIFVAGFAYLLMFVRLLHSTGKALQ